MYKGRPLIIGGVPFLRRSFFGLNPFRWYSVTQIIGETGSNPLEADGYYSPGDGGGGSVYWDDSHNEDENDS